MKKYYSILLFFIAFSCQKNHNEINNGCLNFVQGGPPIQLVDNKDLDTIKYLLTKNKINYSNLQFFQYSNVGFIYIRSYQYVNNLKLFTDEISFLLTKTDTVLRISGDRVASIDLTNSPLLSPGQAKEIFFNEIDQDEIIKKSGLFVDSCVDIEFGYYNLNLHDISLPKKFTTAWKVNSQNKQYPQAIINDKDGNLLDYFNGLYSK